METDGNSFFLFTFYYFFFVLVWRILLAFVFTALIIYTMMLQNGIPLREYFSGCECVSYDAWIAFLYFVRSAFHKRVHIKIAHRQKVKRDMKIKTHRIFVEFIYTMLYGTMRIKAENSGMIFSLFCWKWNRTILY